MSDASPMPPQFAPLVERQFSFYPPIVNIEHNLWEMRRATWAEVLVRNVKTGVEFWIPCRYVGELSSVDEPVMIVGVVKELEYKAGTVWPHERRVLEMPPAVTPAAHPEAAGKPIHASGQPTPESRAGRLIALALGLAALVLLVVLVVYRAGPLRPVRFTAQDEDFLQLSRRDDYFAVVQKLGAPAEDRWRTETGELQYRALWYPQRSYYVILLGTDRRDTRYVGALDRNWRVIHYVDLPNGGDTASMLRALERF